jgi:AcrR family transcriptional regulator
MKKRRYNPEEARQDILAAAESLFAEYGYGDVSTNTIAKKAGVSQSQIHYHYATKRNLLGEVLVRRFSEYYDVQAQLLEQSDLGGQELVEASILAYFSFFQNNPHFVKLLGRAQLDGIAEDDPVCDELTRRGTKLIAERQKAGKLRSDVAPEFIIFGFLSLVAFWFMGRHRFLLQADLPGEPSDYDKQYLEYILKVYLAGIAPR